MEIWIALVGGIMIGWVVEWIIDWLYWRRGLGAFYANEEALRAEAAASAVGLRAANDAAQSARADADGWRRRYESLAMTEKQLRGEISQLTSRVEVLTAQDADLRTALAAEATRAADGVAASAVRPSGRRDDLERIAGIGPIYEQRLFDAGIETYAQLAATPVERLRAIVQPRSMQKVDFAKWIEEAREYAAIVLGDQLPYRLEEIRGIGPTYARRLNAAGIVTYQELARASERQLREIIRPASWQNVDFASWIRQARGFAALVAGNRPVLPLQGIKGIGPVSSLRLELAGIMTFEQLAETSEARLREIIGVNQHSYADWIEQAWALANGGSDGIGPTHA